MQTSLKEEGKEKRSERDLDSRPVFDLSIYLVHKFDMQTTWGLLFLTHVYIKILIYTPLSALPTSNLLDTALLLPFLLRATKLEKSFLPWDSTCHHWRSLSPFLMALDDPVVA